jgi:tudor domain-containing protein 1/4/6/7
MNVMCNSRVCVSNVINDNMVSVYFCDYGDVSVMPLEKLQPLTDQFKELPYQAIKAKLAGKCCTNRNLCL